MILKHAGLFGAVFILTRAAIGMSFEIEHAKWIKSSALARSDNERRHIRMISLLLLQTVTSIVHPKAARLRRRI